MKIATFDGPPADIAPGAIGDLRARLRGRLLIDGDPDYDCARVVFNGLFDRRPALIAQCRDAADVAEAVRFAAGSRLLTAVRGGGHSIAGHSTGDAGVVIDLSPMRAVVIDPTRQTARVGGGATWADVDSETQVYGLATPGGIPYLSAQQAFDSVFPNTGEVLGYWKSLFLEDLSDPTIDVIAEAAADRARHRRWCSSPTWLPACATCRRRPLPLPPATPRSSSI